MPKPPPTSWRHHPDAVFGDMENLLGQQIAQEMRTLGRAPQRVGILARVVFAERAARLHRVDDDAVVDQGQRHAVTGPGGGALDRSTGRRPPNRSSDCRDVRPTPRAGPASSAAPVSTTAGSGS